MVRVVENTAPVAQGQTLSTSRDAPVNLSLGGTDAEGGALTFVIVTPPAHGTLSGTLPSVTYTPDPGYVGPDSFTFRARDCGLDSNVATVRLDMVSRPPPNLTCPADQLVEATGPAGAEVTYPPATVPDIPAPTVTYAPPSGSTLPLGDTTVTVTAEDADGTQATCTFRVTVRDTTPPTVRCPEDMRVGPDESGGAFVTFVLPESTDLVSTPTVTASPESGSHFSPGENLVAVTATDAAGNAAQCLFGITVQTEVVSIAGGGCQASGGGAHAALIVLSVLATWGARRRRERGTP